MSGATFAAALGFRAKGSADPKDEGARTGAPGRFVPCCKAACDNHFPHDLAELLSERVLKLRSHLPAPELPAAQPMVLASQKCRHLPDWPSLQPKLTLLRPAERQGAASTFAHEMASERDNIVTNHT